jgi:hypothetical protein
MRVRMLHKISGTYGDREWPNPGEEIDIPDHAAVSLLNTRMAEAVEEPAKTEKAVAKPRATTRRKPAAK